MNLLRVLLLFTEFQRVWALQNLIGLELCLRVNEVASRRRFELPVSRMRSWRPGPLDERDIGILYGITLDHLIKICLF